MPCSKTYRPKLGVWDEPRGLSDGLQQLQTGQLRDSVAPDLRLLPRGPAQPPFVSLGPVPSTQLPSYWPGIVLRGGARVVGGARVRLRSVLRTQRLVECRSARSRAEPGLAEAAPPRPGLHC